MGRGSVDRAVEALADIGQTVPQIARFLGRHEQTVRRWVKAFLAEGFAALANPVRHAGGRPRRVTDAQLDALSALLDATTRAWTTRQLVDWLAREQGVRVHPLHLSRLLHRRGYCWRRTRRSLLHQRRDPDLQAAKRAELEALKNQARGGVLDLYYLDECGFRPTLPTGYAWCRRGRRLAVPYEAPQGRRVNVVGAHPPGLVRQRRCVVVVDHYSVHHAKVVNAEVPALAAAGVEFFFLPPYSPELNLIEVAWRHIKYEQLPERSYPTADGLQATVEAAMSAYAHHRATLRASSV